MPIAGLGLCTFWAVYLEGPDIMVIYRLSAAITAAGSARATGAAPVAPSQWVAAPLPRTLVAGRAGPSTAVALQREELGASGVAARGTGELH